jgi:hypothetical protein
MNRSSTVPKSRYGQQRRPPRGSMRFTLTDMPWEGCSVRSPLRKHPGPVSSAYQAAACGELVYVVTVRAYVMYHYLKVGS